MVKKISIKKVKSRIYVIILSISIFSIATSNICCNLKQELFKIPEEIKEVVNIRSDINISPINDVIGNIEDKYLYDIKREELITSAFEGIIKSTDEKYPELLSEQDKIKLFEIRNKYSKNSLDSIVELIRKLIEKKDKLKSDDLIMYANKSIMKSLQDKDKYAYFFYPENYKIVMENYSPYVSGVGMYVNQLDGKIVVVQPIENTPAYRAGIKTDDVILSVNGQLIKEMNIDEVIALIRGKAGTKVIITFYRPDKNDEFTKELIREKIHIPNFISKVFEDDIGYIHYRFFRENGAIELKEELEKMYDEGVKVLILDLRVNTGGLLSDAVNVAQIFIEKGNIVVVKEKKDSITYRGKETEFANFPLVIIVGKYSASASEILAGALQDHNRAELVGNTTFGKGKVQMIFSLSDGSGIKFTTANYYLPSERSIEEIGITPDIIINDNDKTEEDEQLEEAKKVASEYISKIDI